MQCVPGCEGHDDLVRLCAQIDKWIADGTVPDFPQYAKTKVRPDKALPPDLLASLPLPPSPLPTPPSQAKAGCKPRASKKKEADEAEALMTTILARRAQRAGLLSTPVLTDAAAAVKCKQADERAARSAKKPKKARDDASDADGGQERPGIRVIIDDEEDEVSKGGE